MASWLAARAYSIDRQKMKTHCAYGHDLKIAGINKRGRCLVCDRQRMTANYHAKPEVAARDKLRDMYAHAYIWQPDK